MCGKSLYLRKKNDMTTFIIIVVALALFILAGMILRPPEMSNNKQKPIKKPKRNAPGMYFMEMYQETKRQRKSSPDTVSIPYYEHAADWYRTLGLACQGRIPEVDDMYNALKDERYHYLQEYVALMNLEKNQIYAMARIAKRVEDAPIGFDLGYETIGEYTDKKLLKNRFFMEKYTYYVSFDFEKFYNEIAQT
jgi:hypothetical protein